MLYVWKYQATLNRVFWIERPRNFSIFVWSVKREAREGGEEGVKPYWLKSTQLTQNVLSKSPNRSFYRDNISVNTNEMWGFLKTTNQPTTYHRPPINRPTDHLPPTNRQPTKCTGHRPTDYRPIRNMRTRNSITNLKWISSKKIWDRVVNTISRMWAVIFWLKRECVIEKIKSLTVKLINYKTYGNCIWIKRIKTGENYAETIIEMPENVSTSSTAKLPNCQYSKSSIKSRSLYDKCGYLLLFSSIKDNAQILLARLPLNPPPAMIQLWSKIFI